MARKFPYTNFHDLNLDWIIKRIQNVYNVENPPPYPVRTVNGQEGNVNLTGDDIPLSANDSTPISAAVDSKIDKPQTTGANGQVLTADGLGGVRWSTPADPEDIIDDSAGALTYNKTWSAHKLFQLEADILDLDNDKMDKPASAGSDGQILSLANGLPVWINQTDVDQVKNDLGFDANLINDGYYIIKKEDLESGQWSYSRKDANPARARTKNLFPVKAGMSISYINSTFDTYFGVLETPTSMSYIQTIGWKTDSAGTINITKDGYLTFIIRNHHDTSAPVDPEDYNNIVTIKTKEYSLVLKPGFSAIITTEEQAQDVLAGDANNAPVNTIIAIGVSTLNIINLPPENGNYKLGNLFTFGVRTGNLAGKNQMYIGYLGNIYFRSYIASGWTSWIEMEKTNRNDYVSHDATFSVTDIPVNKYTSFIIPTDTLTDGPIGMESGGYVLYRKQAYSNSNISTLFILGLTNPDDIWYASYNTSRNPALSAWSKINCNIDSDIIEDDILSGRFTIDSSKIEQGWWNWGSKSNSNTRIRYNRLIKISKGNIISFTISPLFDVYFGITSAPGATEWIQYMYWTQGTGNEQKYLINYDGYLGIIIRKHDESAITPADYSGIITIDQTALMPELNKLTCKIFRKVVCCGDSFTAGYIRIDEPAGTPSVLTHEEYAWPHYMATLTGNVWENCGASGANTISWQTTARGLPKAQSIGRAQAYIIGLMINDISQTYHVDLGTINDIGTNNNTYYAQMAKIIRELNSINPDAKIFVNTCPRSGSDYDAYNQAVRDIVDLYDASYPVYCIDLYQYKYLYDNITLSDDSLNGHLSAIGYEQLSEIYAYILSDFMNKNISDFQNVHKIPFD